MKEIIYAIATLSGTIMGVGLFSLPYITLQVGFPLILAYFLVLGTLTILVHLLFGEVALKTPDLKRLPGFASYHLGKWGERVALFSSIIGIFGAILAYLIVGGEFLTGLLSPIFGFGNIFWTLVYFSFASLLIFFGIKSIAKFELWGLLLFLLILIFFFVHSFRLIKLDNLFFPTNLSQWFLPYGPILFSLWGASLIPETEEILGEKKKLLKKVIIFSILISIFVYLFFICLILGISGKNTSPSALTGLQNFLGKKTSFLILFFGALTTFTSIITLGLTLKKIFWYDLNLNKNLSWALTTFIPLVLFLKGVNQFISVISFVGGIMLGIEGILILLMYRKINPKNFLTFPLIMVFLIGILYEIIYFLK